MKAPAHMNGMIAARLKAQHERRMASLESILSELRQRNLSSPAMAEVAGVSLTASFNYRVALLADGIIERCELRGHMGVYKLRVSWDDVRAYLDNLRAAGPRMARLAADPKPVKGSHVHMAQDETERPRRPTRVVVRRHWMDLALFGDGPAHNLAAYP